MWFWHLVGSSRIYQGMRGGREKPSSTEERTIQCLEGNPLSHRLSQGETVASLAPCLGISLKRKSVNSNKEKVVLREVDLRGWEGEASAFSVLRSTPGSNKHKMLWQGPRDPLSDHPGVLALGRSQNSRTCIFHDSSSASRFQNTLLFEVILAQYLLCDSSSSLNTYDTIIVSSGITNQHAKTLFERRATISSLGMSSCSAPAGGEAKSWSSILSDSVRLPSTR